MEWIFGVTAFNWGIFLIALLKRRGLILELQTFFAFTTLLLIGPIAVQNGLTVWISLTPGLAWAGTLMVMFWVMPIAAFAFKSPNALKGVVLIWYLVFLGLSVASVAEVWNLGYLYSGLIFFWPLVAVVIPVGLAIHSVVRRKTTQLHENRNAPE
jgi:hypothetical protein